MVRRSLLPALLALSACTTGGGGSDGPPPVSAIEGTYVGTVRVDANSCEPDPDVAGVGEVFAAEISLELVGDALRIGIDVPALGLPPFSIRTRGFLFDPFANRLVFAVTGLPLAASTGCSESLTLSATLDFDPAAGTYDGAIEGEGEHAGGAGCAAIPDPCALDLSAEGDRT